MVHYIICKYLKGSQLIKEQQTLIQTKICFYTTKYSVVNVIM